MKTTKVMNAARAVHNANRDYYKTLGDNSQPLWTDAPQWQRDSAVNGVLFHQANPDATPEDSHKSWLAEKEAAGWVYGAVKDEEAKTHPCFLPYNELPEDQRHKDALFISIMKQHGI